MQVTKGIWRMREQCVPGSLSSAHAQEPGNEARSIPVVVAIFEFGRGFYGNTYTSVSSGLTLTPGPLQIFFVTVSEGKLGTRLTYVQQPVANK